MPRGARVAPFDAPRGIFETIAGALSELLERPLLLTLPVALDLSLWGGARLSPAALTDPLARWFARQDGADARGMADTLHRLGATGDMGSILGWLVPSLLAGVERADVYEAWERGSLGLGSAWLVLGLVPVLLLTAVALGMGFGVVLANVVRRDASSAGRLARAAAVATVRYVGFVVLVGAVIVALAVPLAVMGAVFLAAGINVVPALGAALALPALLAAMFLAFVGEAIVLAEVGPLRAASLSFGVVRRNAWSTVGLLLVLVTVAAGLPRLLGNLTGTAPGLLIAILGNAFVATGLALARMQFFHDRLRRWRADAVPTTVPAG